ncbi:MAG: AI-2E family transporter [Akkermansiaceae bacterium]
MLWRAVTGIAIVIIGALLVGLIWLSSNILGYLQPVLVPVAVAGIVAYLLDPVVRWLQRKGMSRLRGIIVVFSIFLLFFGGLTAFVASNLSDQFKEVWTEERKQSLVSVSSARGVHEMKSHDNFFGSAINWALAKDRELTMKHLENGGHLVGLEKIEWHLPRQGTELIPLFHPKDAPMDDEVRKQTQLLLDSNWRTEQTIDGSEYATSLIALENFHLTRIGGMIFGNIEKLFNWLTSSSGKILGFLGLPIGLIMVPIYLYYFLKESDSIQSNWHDYVPLKASKFKDEVIATLAEINGYLISFFRGQVLVAFIDGILVGIALTIFGLPYGFLIGVVMALLGIIPFIGNILCLLPACVIAYFHGHSEPFGLSQWAYVFGVVAIFFVVQQINSLVTAPKIVGDSVGLHPMTVIFSMLFWSLVLGGFLGALLAVPLTAAVKVIFRRYVWERTVEPTLPPHASG